MSIAAPPSPLTETSPRDASRRCPVNLADAALIPEWVADLSSFREWAQSSEYPTVGKYSFLRGEIWADLSMEQLFSHNQLKTKLTAALSDWADQQQSGYVFSAGVRLSDPRVGLSTEPDLVYVSFDSIRAGRVRLVEGQTAGFVELERTPDLVVEIVSATSIRKDNETLRGLYAECGVPEYWLLDARHDALQFHVLQLQTDQYTAASPTAGGTPSMMVGKTVSIERIADALGHAQFRVKLL